MLKYCYGNMTGDFKKSKTNSSDGHLKQCKYITRNI